MSTSTSTRNSALYGRFLDTFNRGDLAAVAELIAPDFEDHHPGFDISGRDSYLTALRDARETLRIRGELLEALETGDKLTTRVRLSGKHVGPVLGVEATGRDVTWDTNEIWRVRGDVFAERWAVDDLLGLRRQIGTEDANVALAQRVSDVVNAHEYDAMDELFARHGV
jgi:predicted ester cyclase